MGVPFGEASHFDNETYDTVKIIYWWGGSGEAYECLIVTHFINNLITTVAEPLM
jgi:hypothetical protein